MCVWWQSYDGPGAAGMGGVAAAPFPRSTSVSQNNFFISSFLPLAVNDNLSQNMVDTLQRGWCRRSTPSFNRFQPDLLSNLRLVPPSSSER